MRYLIFLACLLCATTTLAIEWEDQQTFKGRAGTQTLRVISSTDTSVFAPIITSFLNANPTLNIEYRVAGSADIYAEFRRAPQDYDLVISSAMDLQFKLVNDGYAHRVADLDHPDWAQWRKSLFGFTLEPASIVINKNAFEDLPVPETRQQLIEVLRSNPQTFRGKIGTYDVRVSGLGYLFATQDARASETYWRLMEIMGSLNTRLYCCSGDMIRDLASGEILLSYNALGSYARARAELADQIEVILPKNLPNTMMRTALIARDTRQAPAAIQLLRYLTSSAWSQNDGTATLPPLRAQTDDSRTSTISLEPGLMIFLDRLKRRAFLQAWESAVIQ